MTVSPGSGTVPDVSALQDMILSTESLEAFLGEVILQVTGVGAEVLSCGLTVPSSGRSSPFASRASDLLASSLDGMQYGVGDGPCLQALRTGEVVTSDNLEHESRWQEFVQYATGVGVRSVLSVPLRVRDSVVAVLNVYQRSEGGVTYATSQRVVMFAEEAAGAVAVAVRLEQHQRANAGSGTVSVIDPG